MIALRALDKWRVTLNEDTCCFPSYYQSVESNGTFYAAIFS